MYNNYSYNINGNFIHTNIEKFITLRISKNIWISNSSIPESIKNKISSSHYYKNGLQVSRQTNYVLRVS